MPNLNGVEGDGNEDGGVKEPKVNFGGVTEGVGGVAACRWPDTNSVDDSTRGEAVDSGC